MSAKSLQHFSSGLFLATAVLGGVIYFSQESNRVQPTQEITVPSIAETLPSIVEMKEQLENEGFTVLTAEEPLNEQNEAKEEPDAQLIYTMFLQVNAGMSSLDVAEQLTRGHIIEDQSIFLNYIDQHQLAKLIKIGEYELTSNQSIEEIVSQLTK